MSRGGWPTRLLSTDCSIRPPGAETIGRTFGTAFAYENGNGTWAIARPVLAAFRKLTADTVVWERSTQLWRHRMPSDPPGRRQVD